MNRKTTRARRSLETWLWAPLAVCAFGAAGVARADDAADTATARALGVEGVTLAESGRCREAIEKLERAEKLHHAPTTATRLGECEIDVGRIVLGTERLQRVVREPLAPNAHPAFVAAVARAQKALQRALPRIATLRISVSAPPGSKLAVVIDDEPVPDAVVDMDRRIDPGVHHVQVTAPGLVPSSAMVTIDEGQTQSVALELPPDPNAISKSTGPEPRAPSHEHAATEPTGGSKVPAIAAFGVGGLGLGVGMVGAATVARKSASLANRCDANKVCPPDAQADISLAKRWATVSTIGFAVAGVGAATGVVLLMASGKTSSSSPTGLRVEPAVGLTSVGASGTF